jgi:NADH:ubiquinone oxidoreductase subunit F (NADH-binding)
MTTLTATRTGRLLPADGAQTTLSDHLAIHGPLSLAGDTDHASQSRFSEEIAGSGLLGRGGAAFPTSRKWETMSRSRRRPMVVVNAMEGEPASSKDHVLLTRSPHLVLDGAEVTASAVNASEIKICIAADNAVAAASMERALAERRRSGLVRCLVTVHRPPGRYVAGEESALVSWLDNGRALPSFRPDKSVPLEVSRRPALVHNAETMSQIALIARNGAAWFRQRGTVEAPGSSLVTISGAVDAPGVFEVELGTPLSEMLGWAGVNAELSGVLLGGYGGAWLDTSLLDVPYTPAALSAAGATLGVGIVIALPATSCGLCETARIATYMAGQSAGQCGPCVFGLPALASDLEQLALGRPEPELVERIWARADAIEGRGACRHPDGVVRLVRSALGVFANDVLAHAQGRPCTGVKARSVLPEGTTQAGRIS